MSWNWFFAAGLAASGGAVWYGWNGLLVCDALDGVKDPALIPVLARLARRWETAKSAAARLEEFGPAAVPALCALLGPDNSHSENAAEALGRIGDPSAAPALVAAAVRPRGAGYYIETPRRAAAVAALKLGPQGVGALVSALWGAEKEALDSCGRAIAACPDAAAAPAFRPLLKHPDAGLRSAAVAALKRLTPDAAAADMIEILAVDPDSGVRLDAARALAESRGTPAAQEAMISVLRSGGHPARWAAAGALEKWSTPLSLSDRAVVLAVRGKVAEAAALGEAAVPGLIAALDDGMYDVMAAAATELEKALRKWAKKQPKELLVKIDQLPRTASGSTKGWEYNGPCDETGHEAYVSKELDLFPLRQLALQELQRRNKEKRGKDGA